MPKQAPSATARPPFTPVATRARADGWTPEKQVAFVEALSESGCVTEACAAVGRSKQSAYALRAWTDAQAFRVAWDAALDFAVRRLSDECFSRALHGQVVPHFYQGEQVGEHRRYDTRLALFLLRYRDPLRYAATKDEMVYSGHPEHAAIAFSQARARLSDAAHGVASDAEEEESEVTPAYTSEPVARHVHREKERQFAESDAPVTGDHSRRSRILELRRQHHADRAAAAGETPSPRWPPTMPDGPAIRPVGG